MRARRKRRRDFAAVARKALGGAVLAPFDAMAIAEDELARAGIDPPGLFAALVPPPHLVKAPSSVYRAHARELIARAAAGDDLRPATAAEILAPYLDVALLKPIGAEAAAVVEELFALCFPDAELPGEPMREAWPGQVAEEIASLRRSLAVPTRVLKKDHVDP